MALLANAVGVPARVSLDGTVEANGTVYGKDVRADVELDTAEYGWVTLPASAVHRDQEPAAAGAEGHAAAPAGQGRPAPAQRRRAGRGGQLEQRRGPDRAAAASAGLRHPGDRARPAQVRGHARCSRSRRPPPR